VQFKLQVPLEAYAKCLKALVNYEKELLAIESALSSIIPVFLAHPESLGYLRTMKHFLKPVHRHLLDEQIAKHFTIVD
jgi:hypothetical protein